MLAISLIGAFIVGTILGLCFRALILVPASVGLAVLVAVGAMLDGSSPQAALLRAIFSVLILQAGYFVGLLSGMIPELLHLGRAPSPRRVPKPAAPDLGRRRTIG
jgi:hypothetical protein